MTELTHYGVEVLPTTKHHGFETTVEGPATFSFWWKVSSELGFDFLIFSVDGVAMEEISGEMDFQQLFLVLNSGSHTLRWEYVKDDSESSGADFAWLDKVLPATSATQKAKLLPSDAQSGAWFGGSVALEGDTAIIGAQLNPGSAYIFERDSSGNWNQKAELLPSDAQIPRWFGKKVAMSGNTAIVGAVADDVNGFQAGSAYIFDLVIASFHNADQNGDFKIQLSPELTRVIQFFNSDGYHLEAGTEDGFAPGKSNSTGN